MKKAPNILLIEDVEVMKFNRVLSNIKNSSKLLRQIMVRSHCNIKGKEIILILLF
jgi:hypothetical protein